MIKEVAERISDCGADVILKSARAKLGMVDGNYFVARRCINVKKNVIKLPFDKI